MEVKDLTKLLPLVGIVIFIYILVQTGLDTIWKALLMVSPVFLVAACMILIPRVLSYAYKMFLLCRMQNISVSYCYMLRVFLISMFYSVITPASVGGFVKLYYIKRAGDVPWEKAIANTLLDQFTSFFAGVTLALLGAFLIIDSYPSIFLFVLLAWITLIVLAIVLLNKKRGNKLFDKLVRPLIPSKWKNANEVSPDLFYEDIPSSLQLTIPFLIEVLMWALSAFQVYLIGLAFPDFQVPLGQFIILYAISIVAASIPASISGIGLREGMLAVVLSVYGVSPGTAVVMSLLGFVIKTVPLAIAGWICTLFEHSNRKEIESYINEDA